MRLLPDVAKWQQALGEHPPIKTFDWENFSGGMDYTSPDGQVSAGRLRLIQGALLSRWGEIIYPGGPNPTSVDTGNCEVYDFIRYRREPDTLVTTAFDSWLYVRNNGGTKQFCRTATNGTITVLGTVTTLVPFDICMLQVGKRAITTSRDNLPLVWRGVGSTATTLGYEVPDPTFPAITIGHSGLGGAMGTDGFSPYQYTFAFEDVYGNFTNPNDTLSTELFLPTAFNWYVEVKVPVNALPTGLLSADIAKIHVYRIGGSSSELRESKVFVPGGTSGGYFLDAATGSFPIDSTIDAALPDIFANYSNTPPPKGLTTLKEHLGRIFGAGQVTSTSGAAGQELGSNARLWFSRPYMPESWGNDDNGVDDDGGFLDIDDDNADPIMCLESTGSVLVIARRQSIYTLFGAGFTTFRFDKRASIGVPSRRCICRFGNRVILFCGDGRVYNLGDRELEQLSMPVDRFIDEAGVDFSKAVLFTHDRKLHVCLPKVSGPGAFTCVLEENTGGWSVLQRFDVNAAHSIAQIGAIVPSCMIAPRGTSGIGQEYYYEFDNQSLDAPATTIELYTDRIRMLDNGGVGRLTELYIDMKYAGSLTLEITCEGTTYTYNYSSGIIFGNRYGVPLAYLNTPLHLKGLPPSLEGRWFEVRLTGSVTQLHIRNMHIYAIPVRGSL